MVLPSPDDAEENLGAGQEERLLFRSRVFPLGVTW